MMDVVEIANQAMRGTGRGSRFSEDDLLATIRRILSRQPGDVLIGAGDDAAVVEISGRNAVLTADMLVERVHFDERWFSPKDLGHKSLVVNVSDVAAMGATPRFALVSLGLRVDTDEGWVEQLYSGLLEAGERYGVTVIGGDISRSDVTVVAVTVAGEAQPSGAVTRRGARAEDLVVVTGTLGGAAGGLDLVRAAADRAPEARGPKEAAGAEAGSAWRARLLARHLRPVARLDEGRVLARAGASAMMDLSDGLTKDLGRLCRESGVGADVRLGDIPVDPDLLELRRIREIDPLTLALEGGEDMELLATLPHEALEGAAEELDRQVGTRLSVIGSIRDGHGLHGIEPDGSVRTLDERGWDHFAS